jgi:L-lactate utilization protein LutB
MEDVHAWQQEKLLQKTVNGLKKRGFEASYYPNRQTMTEDLWRIIPDNAKVGIGGSITIRELGLVEELEKRGNKVFQHWQKDLPPKGDEAIRRKAMEAAFYLTSANAITTAGDIINIDGIGNRVAAMIYGPKNVVIIAGYNKIVNSIDEGVRRSREIAGVLNARRINAKTPCAETGVCSDCSVAARICRVTTIIQYKPNQTDVCVLLVNERLGY